MPIVSAISKLLIIFGAKVSDKPNCCQPVSDNPWKDR